MVELLGHVDAAAAERRDALWRGLFALATLYVTRGQDVTFIAKRLVSGLRDVVT